jgi:hypothetical protein
MAAEPMSLRTARSITIALWLSASCGRPRFGRSAQYAIAYCALHPPLPAAQILLAAEHVSLGRGAPEIT